MTERNGGDRTISQLLLLLSCKSKRAGEKKSIKIMMPGERLCGRWLKSGLQLKV